MEGAETVPSDRAATELDEFRAFAAIRLARQSVQSRCGFPIGNLVSRFRPLTQAVAVRPECAAGLAAVDGGTGGLRLHPLARYSPRMVRGSHSASSGQNRTAARPVTWRAMNGHMA